MAQKPEEKDELISEERIRKLQRMIEYSNKYEDETYEYRHVTLPKELLKIFPKSYWNKNGGLRLLTEDEWRGIGISQGLGWEHYEVHAPEPHVFLFRRLLGYVQPTQPEISEAIQAPIITAQAQPRASRVSRNV